MPLVSSEQVMAEVQRQLDALTAAKDANEAYRLVAHGQARAVIQSLHQLKLLTDDQLFDAQNKMDELNSEQKPSALVAAQSAKMKIAKKSHS